MGLSQEAFGALGGVSRAAQFTYETGKRSPDSDYFQLMEAAGVDVAFIMTGKLNAETLQPWQAEIVDALTKLDPEWRSIILELVRKATGHVPPTIHERLRGYSPEPRVEQE